MCALWRHLASACEVKAHLIGYVGNTLFLAVFGLNLVVVDVHRDSRVLRDSIGTSYIVAVLRDRLL